MFNCEQRRHLTTLFVNTAHALEVMFLNVCVDVVENCKSVAASRIKTTEKMSENIVLIFRSFVSYRMYYFNISSCMLEVE